MDGTQIGAEIAIDVCCATIAEVRKRGEKFWGEFEFYLSDLAVGMVLDIVLVTLLAPVAVVGKYPKAVESTGEAVATTSAIFGPLGASSWRAYAVQVQAAYMRCCQWPYAMVHDVMKLHESMFALSGEWAIRLQV